MKKIILLALLLVTKICSFSQNIILSDSVIYIDKNPVAFYFTNPINSSSLYNINVFTLTGEAAIEAEAIEFTSPVRDFNSFYFYELRFPGIKDTFSIYFKGESFAMEIAKILAEYKLINENKIVQESVHKFKESYAGVPALQTMIDEMSDYLKITRHFDEQIIRDRTKPVIIVDGKDILQDNVKIGTINATWNNRPGQNSRATFSQPAGKTYVAPLFTETKISNYSPNNGAVILNKNIPAPKNSPIDRDNTIPSSSYWSKENEIFLLTGRKTGTLQMPYSNNLKTNLTDIGYTLFEISRNKDNKEDKLNENILRKICYLIENYQL